MTFSVTQQAHLRTIAHPIGLVGVAVVVIGLTGCPTVEPPNSTTFSAAALVTVADGVMVEVPLGAGAPSLADSSWALYRADDDTLLFRADFGTEGQIERLFDSFVFAKEWLGSQIVPDTRAHPTDFPGGSYVAGAYAAEQDGGIGVLGVVHGLLLGTHLGTATLSFSGAVVGDRIDGPMIRTVTIFADTPFPAPGDTEFDAYALRER